MTRLEKNKNKKIIINGLIIAYINIIIITTIIIMKFTGSSFIKEYDTLFYYMIIMITFVTMIIWFIIFNKNIKIKTYIDNIYENKDYNNLVRGIWAVKDKNLQKAADIMKNLKFKNRRTLLFGLIYGSALCSDNEDLYNDAINQLEKYKQK